MARYGEMTDARLAEISQIMAVWVRERLEVKIESHIVGEIFESLIVRLKKSEAENAKLRRTVVVVKAYLDARGTDSEDCWNEMMCEAIAALEETP